VDLSLLRQAGFREQLYYGLFQAALAVCRFRYHAQRLYYTYWSASPCPTWLPVRETKEPMR
jgi:hypothetical protein